MKEKDNLQDSEEKDDISSLFTPLHEYKPLLHISNTYEDNKITLSYILCYILTKIVALRQIMNSLLLNRSKEEENLQFSWPVFPKANYPKD